MRRPRTWRDFVTTIQAQRDTLQGVILYEDGPAGMMAKDSFEQAFPKLTGDGGNPLIMWKFDMMCLPRLRACAAQDIRNSQIVYVAAHGGDALPDCVKTCLEKGLGKASSHSRAVVAELDSAESPVTDRKLPTVRCLKAIARRAQAEFFVERRPSLRESYRSISTAKRREQVLPRAGCR